LDTDLEGFWDITYPLIDKVKEKFMKLDTRQANQWAVMEEYDPNDGLKMFFSRIYESIDFILVNNRPRHADDRSKSAKSSKIPVPKSVNDDLKKLIQERRKAAASSSNQNTNVEIFHNPK
jgi:hypothetical protein